MFETLLKSVRSCTACAAQLPHGPRPVLALHPDAVLLIAGQAPGRKAHASGIPFDDASGVRLREWLGIPPNIFHDPARVAILPMGFCFPGTGRSGDLPPRPECAPRWRQPLLAALPRVQLTLVIGRYALAWHLPGSTSLTAAVQDWRRHWPTLLPMPHPSPRNQAWLQRHPWFATDVLPALRSRIASLLATKLS